MIDSSAIDDGQTEAMVQDAIVWSNLHGLVVGQGDGVEDVSIVHAPISLLPTPFPRSEFELAQRIQPLFNSLVHAVASDETYLLSVLHQAAQFDDFTAGLIGVYTDTKQARAKFGSRIECGVHRSDYMLDAPSNSLLQVELNTIASSFGCLSTLVTRLHRGLLQRHPHAAAIAPEQLPEQDAMGAIAEALVAAHEAYLDAHGRPADAVTVMVVQPGERNAYDQQWVQTTLWERHGVRMLRRTLHEIATQGRVSEDGDMTLDGHRVSLFYLRAGYSPADHPSEVEWQARRLMESCDAVSVPSVAYQLAGAKKVQQDLAAPGQLERFVPDAEHVRLLRSCFAGLWSLGEASEPETADIIRAALAAPDDYVLKPQREGGGNNLYGAELTAKLQEGNGLAAYILMQRIRPPENKSILLRKGQHAQHPTLSEVGIYGTYVRAGDAVLLNKTAGHLVRTKTASSNEGGVAAGYACLDSPYLV